MALKCLYCDATETTKWYKNKTQCNCCYNKEYKKANKVKVLDGLRNWRKNNKEYVRLYKNEYNKRTNNSSHLEMKRHTKKLNAMPTWVNQEELKLVYKNRPPGYEVDHIHPLQGELISGLHIPQNLQYLTPSENVLKHNKFDGTYENESWRKK